MKQYPPIATKEEFTKLNCITCCYDNEDNDQTCNILIKILDGAELKSLVCKKKYEKRRFLK